MFSCGVIKNKTRETSPSPLKVKSITTKVIEDVVICKSLLDEKALRPQVCGRCVLSFEGGSLKITPAEGCPRYEALGCTTADGKVFVINNVSCTPVTEGGREETKQETREALRGDVYRVRVVGEDCIAYIRAKKSVKVLYTREYSGYFDVGIQTDKETIMDIERMGCVKSVDRE